MLPDCTKLVCEALEKLLTAPSLAKTSVWVVLRLSVSPLKRAKAKGVQTSPIGSMNLRW